MSMPANGGITDAQRITALTVFINNFGSDDVIGYYFPGLASTDVLGQVEQAIGTTLDDLLTTCLNNLVAQAQAQIAATQAGIADIQTNVIAANTVAIQADPANPANPDPPPAS